MRFCHCGLHQKCDYVVCWPICCCLQLGSRLAHVLRRILPISMYLLQKDGQQLSGHDRFLRRVGSTFNAFIEEVCFVALCMHS